MKNIKNIKRLYVWIILISLLISIFDPTPQIRRAIAAAPTMQTNTAENVTTSSATLSGKGLTNGGAVITYWGFKWGTDPSNLTKAEEYGNLATGVTYSKTLSNLQPGTTYYYQAFGANSDGPGYGNLLSFRTQEIPTPTIILVSSISLNRTSLTLDQNGSSATLAATVSPSNATNKSVNWTTDRQAVATVDSNGVVTPHEAGTAHITAMAQDGSGKYATATVTVVDTTIPVTGISLNRTSLSLNKDGSSATLAATVSPSNATNKSVNWSTDRQAVATVDSNGVVTPHEAGTAHITAMAQDGSGKYATATVTVVDTTIPVTGISLNRTSLTLDQNGSSATLAATVSPSNATNKSVNWSTDRQAVATVDSNGVVTPHEAGTAHITAMAQDGSGKYATATVTVVDTTIPVTGISLNRTSLSLNKDGSSATLAATVSPSNATNKSVNWTTDRQAVATVDSNGVVTPHEAGTAHITAMAQDGSGKYATATVTVVDSTIQVTSISLNRTSLSLNKDGSSATLVATVSPSNATNKSVNWSTDRQAVATVDSNGVVTPHEAGTAHITAMAQDGSGKYATATVTVAAGKDTQAPIVTITDPVNGVSYRPGTAINISANATDDAKVSSMAIYINNNKVKDGSSSSLSFSWDTSAISPGTYTIKVNAMDTSSNVGTKSITVVVANPPGEMPDLTGLPLTDEVVQGQKYIFKGTISAKSNLTKVSILVNGNSIASTVPDRTSYDLDNLSVETSAGSLSQPGTYSIVIWVESEDYTHPTRPLGKMTLLVKPKLVDKIPPTINITSPTNESSYIIGTNVNISANAADNVKIGRMAIYINNSKVKDGDTDSLAYIWDTSAISPGTYTIKVNAMDTNGNVGTKTIYVDVKQKTNGLIPTIDMILKVNNREYNDKLNPIVRENEVLIQPVFNLNQFAMGISSVDFWVTDKNGIFQLKESHKSTDVNKSFKWNTSGTDPMRHKIKISITDIEGKPYEKVREVMVHGKIEVNLLVKNSKPLVPGDDVLIQPQVNSDVDIEAISFWVEDQQKVFQLKGRYTGKEIKNEQGEYKNFNWDTGGTKSRKHKIKIVVRDKNGQVKEGVKELLLENSWQIVVDGAKANIKSKPIESDNVIWIPVKELIETQLGIPVDELSLPGENQRQAEIHITLGSHYYYLQLSTVTKKVQAFDWSNPGVTIDGGDLPAAPRMVKGVLMAPIEILDYVVKEEMIKLDKQLLDKKILSITKDKLDTDKDTIPNIVEVQGMILDGSGFYVTTDPRKKDTDGDGLNDNQEVSMFQPLNIDLQTKEGKHSFKKYRFKHYPAKIYDQYNVSTNKVVPVDSNLLSDTNFIDRPPVVLVPGTFASFAPEMLFKYSVNPNLKDEFSLNQLENYRQLFAIDPINKTYDNLKQSLSNLGWRVSGDNRNYFEFPYDWRMHPETNSVLLERYVHNIINSSLHEEYIDRRLRQFWSPEINNWKLDLGWKKVILISHSQGALIARDYLQSEKYKNEVSKFISIAGPNQGEPASYYPVEGGITPPYLDEDWAINTFGVKTFFDSIIYSISHNDSIPNTQKVYQLWLDILERNKNLGVGKTLLGQEGLKFKNWSWQNQNDYQKITNTYLPSIRAQLPGADTTYVYTTNYDTKTKKLLSDPKPVLTKNLVDGKSDFVTKLNWKVNKLENLINRKQLDVFTIASTGYRTATNIRVAANYAEPKNNKWIDGKPLELIVKKLGLLPDKKWSSYTLEGDGTVPREFSKIPWTKAFRNNYGQLHHKEFSKDQGEKTKGHSTLPTDTDVLKHIMKIILNPKDNDISEAVDQAINTTQNEIYQQFKGGLLENQLLYTISVFNLINALEDPSVRQRYGL